MALGNAATLVECAQAGHVRRRTSVEAAVYDGVERTIGACLHILEFVLVRSQAKSQFHSFAFASLICLQGPHDDPPLDDILDTNSQNVRSLSRSLHVSTLMLLRTGLIISVNPKT